MEVLGYKVDNLGNVHLMSRVIKAWKDRSKDKTNYTYNIHSFLNKGETSKNYVVSVEGKFLSDMQIAIDNERNIICSGFYSSKNSSRIEGSYFLKINHESKKIMTKSFYKFDIDFLTQDLTDKKAERLMKKAAKGKNVNLYSYDIDEIITKSDGGSILIAEQFYVTTHTTRNANGGTSTSYTYHHNNIIVIDISASGKIHWAKKIPKKTIWRFFQILIVFFEYY